MPARESAIDFWVLLPFGITDQRHTSRWFAAFAKIAYSGELYGNIAVSPSATQFSVYHNMKRLSTCSLDRLTHVIEYKDVTVTSVYKYKLEAGEKLRSPRG